MSETDTFKARLVKDIEPVARHGIGMTVTILFIWVFHLVLRWTLGEEAKLFDAIPILYVAHMGDSIAFLRFLWKMVKEF